MKAAKRPVAEEDTRAILRHWREAVPNDRLAHLIKDATRALVRALQLRLRKHEFSFGHWAFLRILWESDGLTQRQLSEEAGVMEPTTFQAIQAMEKCGYVKRRRLFGNKKNIYVFLTPKGRALKGKLVPLAEQVNEIAVDRVSARDIAAIRRALLTMIENLARDESIAAKESGRAIAPRGRQRRLADEKRARHAPRYETGAGGAGKNAHPDGS